MDTGKTAPAVLNAANEEAVAAFLDNQVPFTTIAQVNQQVLEQVQLLDAADIESVLAADQEARIVAKALLKQEQQRI